MRVARPVAPRALARNVRADREAVAVGTAVAVTTERAGDGSLPPGKVVIGLSF